MASDASAFIDQPAPPRADERLDVAALRAWLADRIELAGPLQVRQFPAGHSNLTYWVGDGRSQWVLRRPPHGSRVATAHDMGREFRVLSRLHAVYPPAPRALLHCDDASVIGAPFYIMERIEGVILRRDPPRAMQLDGDAMRAITYALIDNLARIHALDLAAAGLADLGHPEGYIERQVRGWTERYQKSRTDDIPEVDRVAAWLDEKRPVGQDDGVLIHNDYKHDNVVLDAADLTRVVGVLDWEMATVGHPLMDLGTTLSYWVQPGDPPALEALRFIPTNAPGSPTREEVVARYAEQTGRDVSRIDFFRTFGLFKTAVVAQQIYYRYATGKTADARFAIMIHGVRALVGEAARVIEGSRL